MANDPFLSFSSNFMNRMLQAQMMTAQMEWQREKQNRTDKRFDMQLARQLDYNQARLGISRSHLDIAQKRFDAEEMHREARLGLSRERQDLAERKFEAGTRSDAETGRFTAFRNLANIRETVAGDPALADEARRVIFRDSSMAGLLTPPRDPLANLPQDSDLTGMAGFLQKNEPVLFESYTKKFAGADQVDEPTKYSADWFETELNYSPQTARILQDRYFGAAPKLRSPSEQVRDARMIMENALSDQEYQIGEEMLREAVTSIGQQRTQSPPKDKTEFDTKLNELGDTPEAEEYFNKHKHLFKIK